VRKAFDVRAARVAGTEMEKYVMRKGAAIYDDPPKVVSVHYFDKIEKEQLASQA
jgi:hypothetical protein